jgi:hypothetical protein
VSTPLGQRDTAPEVNRGGKMRILLIGSLNVRWLAPSLWKKARKDGADQWVTSWCIPGGLVPNTTVVIGGVVRGTDCSSLWVVTHVGANDASKRGVKEILDSFENKRAMVEHTFQNTDIVIGTESWLTEDISGREVFPQGYKIYRCDRLVGMVAEYSQQSKHI